MDIPNTTHAADSNTPESLKYLAPYVLTASSVSLEGLIVTAYTTNDGYTLRIHANLVAEMCIDYCLEYGYEITAVKSRYDGLWFAGVDKFEKIGGDWESLGGKYIHITEGVEYTDVIFRTTEWIIKNNYLGF